MDVDQTVSAWFQLRGGMLYVKLHLMNITEVSDKLINWSLEYSTVYRTVTAVTPTLGHQFWSSLPVHLN